MNLRNAIELQLPQGFLIQQQLASGGTSWVYLAARPGSDERLVVKVLHPGTRKADKVERFRREIRILRKLDHPRIFPVLGTGDVDGALFFTMPYVAGETLESRLRRAGPPSVRETLLVARDVADVLDHAHARGVVHRDVKPGNILLSGDAAYLMDFGFARATSLMSADDAARESGFWIGTPGYMDPDQGRNRRGADWRSDFYSLGCVMYEMLAGRLPFPARSPRAAASQTRLDTPAPDVRALRPDVPEEVAAIVRRNLEPAPSERFATAGALRTALDQALQKASGR
jgi:eukaryotic-like serine/threonine-protein kinase